MAIDPTDYNLSTRELITLLTEFGFGDLVETLLEDRDVWTKGTRRVNRSELCRKLDLNSHQLADLMAEMRLVAEASGWGQQ